MIDLHTHTLFSDGVLLASELVYRAKKNGVSAIALTDHGDLSNFDFVIPRLVKVALELSKEYKIHVLPGVELTYVPPTRLPYMVKASRKLGAKVVVVHGESPVEPVPKGTNYSAVLSGADILAHPGHITEDVVKLAKKNNVCLEITTRDGHNKTNRHIALLAKKFRAKLVLNTDSHLPENIMDMKKVEKTLSMSGLALNDYTLMMNNSNEIVRRKSNG